MCRAVSRRATQGAQPAPDGGTGPPNGLVSVDVAAPDPGWHPIYHDAPGRATVLGGDARFHRHVHRQRATRPAATSTAATTAAPVTGRPLAFGDRAHRPPAEAAWTAATGRSGTVPGPEVGGEPGPARYAPPSRAHRAQRQASTAVRAHGRAHPSPSKGARG